MEIKWHYSEDFWGNIYKHDKEFRCSKCKTEITMPAITVNCPNCGRKLNKEGKL